MNDFRDFKKIADEAMYDIKVSEELRQKTLIRCKRKNHLTISKILVPAACFIVILASINIMGLMSPNTKPGGESNNEVILMTGTDNVVDVLPGDSAETTLQASDANKEWVISAPEEARNVFGTDFLSPAYIPRSFKLETIQALGYDEQRANKIILSYFAGNQSFLIIEEKTEMQNDFKSFNTIDINGATGYLKSGIADGGENEDKLDTEVHWFRNGVHYSVSGPITEDEAIKIALSMK